jgi:hypothetical protein
VDKPGAALRQWRLQHGPCVGRGVKAWVCHQPRRALLAAAWHGDGGQKAGPAAGWLARPQAYALGSARAGGGRSGARTGVAGGRPPEWVRRPATGRARSLPGTDGHNRRGAQIVTKSRHESCTDNHRDLWPGSGSRDRRSSWLAGLGLVAHASLSSTQAGILSRLF